MNKHTSLEKIKEIAKAMVYIDVKVLPYGFVTHPYINNPVIAFPSKDPDKKIELVDILENPESIDRFHEFYCQMIDQAENLYQIYCHINKAYGLTFLKYWKPYLSCDDMSELLRDAWKRQEITSFDINVTKAQIKSMFRQANPNELMSEEERTMLSSLPETITIYRGIKRKTKKDILGLSWTLDLEQAKWFAHRYFQKGYVFQAEISKKDVLAYFSVEQEIIVNETKLGNIHQLF